MHHYCFSGYSALFVCVRRSRQVWGAGAGAGFCVFPVPPPLTLPSPRCVWQVVPSGCPLPSPAGTQFHAVCPFHGLDLVAFLVFPACPLRVCALALSRCPRPLSLPGSVWRADFAWSWCRAPVRPFHAVRAPSRFLPRSRALSGLLWGGATRSGSPCAWPGVACPLAGGPVRPGGPVLGGRGGRAACVPPQPGGKAAGPRGAGGPSTSVCRSAFPGRASKRVSSAFLSFWRPRPPSSPSSCSLVAPGCGPRGALVC